MSVNWEFLHCGTNKGFLILPVKFSSSWMFFLINFLPLSLSFLCCVAMIKNPWRTVRHSLIYLLIFFFSHTLAGQIVHSAVWHGMWERFVPKLLCGKASPDPSVLLLSPLKGGWAISCFSFKNWKLKMENEPLSDLLLCICLTQVMNQNMTAICFPLTCFALHWRPASAATSSSSISVQQWTKRRRRSDKGSYSIFICDFFLWEMINLISLHRYISFVINHANDSKDIILLL